MTRHTTPYSCPVAPSEWSEQRALLGRRLKQLRLQRRMSLRNIAELAGLSAGHLSRVERGERTLDSLTALESLARVLGTTPEALNAPPGRAGPTGATARGDAVTPLLPSVRTAMDMLDLAPDDSIRPRALSQLTADARTVNTLAQAARYVPMARMLPPLLAELHTAAHVASGRDGETAWGLLAEVVRCAHSVGIAVGRNDLSVAALARMDWAAARAGDRAPALRAIREYLRVTTYLRVRDFHACSRLNASGVAMLAGTDDDTPDALVARGQLHLGASITSAHTGDRDGMREHLAEAAHVAELTGERTDRLWVGFGPTNVAVHQVMGLTTAGEHAEAVSAAEGLTFPDEWLPSRVGHHFLDLARAYRWLNKPEKALHALQVARQVAPGQARRHPLARETTGALLRASRQPSTTLSDYAQWIGLGTPWTDG